MFNKQKLEALGFVEVFLIIFFIILVTGILYFIGDNFIASTFLYNSFIMGIIILTIIIASITTFQFIKIKYTRIVKAEVMEELNNYKIKLGSKTAETNNRIVYFEANYSKQLKKIMKDYTGKVKEIEDVKKTLNIKLAEIDIKTAELVIETCIMKADNLKVNSQDYLKEKNELYNRVIKLSDKYPGICAEEFLASLNIEDLNTK